MKEIKHPLIGGMIKLMIMMISPRRNKNLKDFLVSSHIRYPPTQKTPQPFHLESVSHTIRMTILIYIFYCGIHCILVC